MTLGQTGLELRLRAYANAGTILLMEAAAGHTVPLRSNWL